VMDVATLIDRINAAFKELLPADVVQLPKLGETWESAFGKLVHNLEWLVRDRTMTEIGKTEVQKNSAYREWLDNAQFASFPGFLVQRIPDLPVKVHADAVRWDTPLQATFTVSTDAELERQKKLDPAPQYVTAQTLCQGHTREKDQTWIRVDPYGTDKRAVCALCGAVR
jgi:hypothetical protein